MPDVILLQTSSPTRAGLRLHVVDTEWRDILLPSSELLAMTTLELHTATAIQFAVHAMSEGEAEIRIQNLRNDATIATILQIGAKDDYDVVFTVPSHINNERIRIQGRNTNPGQTVLTVWSAIIGARYP